MNFREVFRFSDKELLASREFANRITCVSLSTCVDPWPSLINYNLTIMSDTPAADSPAVDPRDKYDRYGDGKRVMNETAKEGYKTFAFVNHQKNQIHSRRLEQSKVRQEVADPDTGCVHMGWYMTWMKMKMKMWMDMYGRSGSAGNEVRV